MRLPNQRKSVISTLLERYVQQALAEALLIEGVDGVAGLIPDCGAVQTRSNHLRRG